ncbi:hypothetical protein Poly41_09540 [Novipirellula artificiosorum]|uniref:Uncharacterized protein n=2 Tax=Novipirellula artificiosorum TaxID=2528016 RepID=A0A5C6E1Q3_9BACT|nr:hypothetical protein Poly41_09540 [Novipirellula artificiosorum]
MCMDTPKDNHFDSCRTIKMKAMLINAYGENATFEAAALKGQVGQA